ncbi:MAG: rod shape-determining protein [Christensenellaceae bacterium]|jgi:actin-like ATPase involved in cell morphogenesis|nr:rod shape-determining protein [Christensenellaceae bacterium]
MFNKLKNDFVMELTDGNIKFYKKNVGIVLNEKYEAETFERRVYRICPEPNKQHLLVVVDTGAKPLIVTKLKSIAFGVGFSNISFVSTVYALASFFGYNFKTTKPVMSVIIGNAATDFALLSGTKMVKSGTIPIGVSDCHEVIIDKINGKFNTQISNTDAKNIFNNIAVLIPGDTQHIKVNDFVVKADLVREAIYPVYEQIIGAINHILSSAEVDTIRVIKDTGIFIGGVGAKIRGLADAVFAVLGLQCFIADTPKNALIYGAGGLLAMPDVLTDIIAYEKLSK